MSQKVTQSSELRTGKPSPDPSAPVGRIPPPEKRPPHPAFDYQMESDWLPRGVHPAFDYDV